MFLAKQGFRFLGVDMSQHWEKAETNSPKLLAQPRMLRRIEQHLLEGEEVLVLIHSPGSGYLLATNQRCLILKISFWQSALAGSLGGGRVASFYYVDINGIEYNAGMVSGVLEIRTASYESSGNKDFWKGTFSSRNADSNDPFTLSNTFPLTRPEYSDAKPLIGKIQKLISEAKSPGGDKTENGLDVSVALHRLSELRDSGALTETEFHQAKLRILAE